VYVQIAEKLIARQELTDREIRALCPPSMKDVPELLAAADRLRATFRGDSVELCAIVNAKSGGCSEDCSYCAQSALSSAPIDRYPLLRRDAILQKAREARQAGVRRFSIVIVGRKASGEDLKRISSVVRDIRDLGLSPCASLGLLGKDELLLLRDAGLERYHHNLETSERYFPEICRTHTYTDKMKTIGNALDAGLSVCSGGIFGMGEGWQDRVSMARALEALGIESVPINFLVPIPGTPFGSRQAMNPVEALAVIALYRFMLPRRQIRICGGRVQVLGDLHPFIFQAGADALMTGNYLTTTGRSYGNDLDLVARQGLKVT
jgi:biotin synthase